MNNEPHNDAERPSRKEYIWLILFVLVVVIGTAIYLVNRPRPSGVFADYSNQISTSTD